MASTSEERGDGRPDTLVRRLADGRWLIAGAVLLAAALRLADLASPAGSLGFVAGIVALVVLLPRPAPGNASMQAPEPQDKVWPETGMKLFAEALPDPCFVLDRRGVVRFANGQALAAFGIRPGDALTFRLRVPDLLAAFERVSQGGPPERVEFVERVPTERWFAAWFARIDPGARPGAFTILVIDDLTETRRIERVRADFVANASHELRTPLASLAGFVETLQGPARDDPAARDRFLKIMQDQAMRMSRLIGDLLSLSRVEMKAHVRPTGDVDLAAIVRHVVDALEPLAGELGVTIEVAAPRESVTVAGERDELVQVFENLIENACKYGQAGKRVAVTVTAGGAENGPSVTVRDFGPGIADEHIPRLTERFYRIDVDESRRHRGTGLGLAIVKHILTRHQARLSIESRLGEGATFTVVFPQATAAAPITAEERIL